MKGRVGAEALEPEDLALVQQCFDMLLAHHRINRSSDEAAAMAKSLIAAFGQGVRDKDALLKSATTQKPTGPLEKS